MKAVLGLAFCVASLGVTSTSLAAEPEVRPFGCTQVTIPATTAATASQASRSIFDRLSDCHFSLRATVNDDEQDSSFAYSHDGSQHVDGLKSQFALSYRSAPLGQFASQPAPFLLLGVDGSVGTDTQKSKNTSVLNIRPEFGWRLSEFTGSDTSNGNVDGVFGVFSRFGPVLEATQDFKVENYLTELALTVTRDARSGPVFGRSVPIASSGISMRFRPYLNFYAGTNLTGASLSGELNKTRLRVVPQPILEFSLDNADRLGLDSVILQLVDTFFYLPLEGRSERVGKTVVYSHATNNQFSASLQLGIGKDFSFGPTFTTGATAPLFKRDTTFTVALKLGFGVGGGEGGPPKSTFAPAP